MFWFLYPLTIAALDIDAERERIRRRHDPFCARRREIADQQRALRERLHELMQRRHEAMTQRQRPDSEADKKFDQEEAQIRMEFEHLRDDMEKLSKPQRGGFGGTNPRDVPFFDHQRDNL
jgi:chromosome segregation ATPase